MKEKLIKLLKDCGALEFGNFVLKSGRRSEFYLDLRKLCFSSNVAIVANLMNSRIQNLGIEYDAIGGPEIGAIPLIGAMLALHTPPISGFGIRKEEKEHGKSGFVIGSVKPKDRCIMIEDVTTSGGSLLQAIERIEKFGCTVSYALTVLDRAGEIGPILMKRDIGFDSLLTLDDLE